LVVSISDRALMVWEAMVEGREWVILGWSCLYRWDVYEDSSKYRTFFVSIEIDLFYERRYATL
jgi:hypothetical protein